MLKNSTTEIDTELSIFEDLLSKSKKRRTIVSSEDESISPTTFSKSGQKTGYSATAPIIPYYILKMITEKTSHLAPRKKGDFVIQICKYWALKREVRRGAALLKRLHLEVKIEIVF